MNIFFDVDYTILAVDGSLRPGTRDVFEKLVEDGHRVFIWSGIGIRTDDVLRHKLDDLVSGIYQKPLQDFEVGLQTFKIPVRPDFVIDDYSEIVQSFGGMQVRPYFFSSPDDTEMKRVYEAIKQAYEQSKQAK